ncbi:MAG: hypothetical protein JWR69_1530 [Pedosphaera sp.]|nr:hypothetical protein [Pedosphaera sp.]
MITQLAAKTEEALAIAEQLMLGGGSGRLRLACDGLRLAAREIQKHREESAANVPGAPVAPPVPATQKIAKNRIVNYVFVPVVGDPVIRPAICVEDFGGQSERINLQVFTDGANDGHDDFTPAGVLWKENVAYSATPQPGTWHWPARS